MFGIISCHLLTPVQNFTEIVPGKPSVGGVKHKSGSKIWWTYRRLYLCHVRVSYLLITFGTLCMLKASLHTPIAGGRHVLEHVGHMT